MEVTINFNVYKKAQNYAQQQGLSLSSIIEDFLVRLISQGQKPYDQAVPDVVMSLLGAGLPLPDTDLNGREAYYEHLEEKHQ